MDLYKINRRLHFVSIFFLILAFWAFIDEPIYLIISQILFFLTSFIKIILKKNITKKSSTYIVWGFIWLFYCLLSSVWSVNVEGTISYAISILQTVLVSIFLVVTIDNHREVCFIEKTIIISGVILAIRLLIVTPMSSWGNQRLGLGIGMHVNHIATNLLISLMFTLKQFIMTKKRRNILLILLFIVVNFMTASKKSMIISLLSIIIIAPSYQKDIVKKTMYLLSIIFMVIILYSIIMKIPMIYELAGRRMEGFIALITGTGEVDASTTGRKELIMYALEVFTKNPILGVGLNGFRYLNVYKVYAHCNFVELLASCGTIGFSIYYYIYYFIFKKGLKQYKNNRESAIYLMIVICILIMELMQITYYLESIQVAITVIYMGIFTVKEELKIINHSNLINKVSRY